MKSKWRDSSLYVLLVFAFSTYSCGDDRRKLKKGNGSNQEVTEENNTDDLIANGELSSEEAFKLTAYPILKENCASCHAAEVSPFFASEDSIASHKALVEGNKVDFAEPVRSRIVVRLAEEQHNCWSNCEEDAKEIEEAVKTWAAALKTGENSTTPEYISSALLFSDAGEGSEQPSTDTYVWEAEAYDSIQAPYEAIDANGASGGRILRVPAGNGGRIVDLTLNNVGRMIYTVDIAESGNYRLYSRAAYPNGNADSVYFRINDGPFIYWNFQTVNSNDFVWNQAANGQNRADYSIQLPAGSHTITIRRREELIRLDQFALSKDPAFNGSASNVGNEVKQLAWDLSDIVGGAATFKVTISKYDDFSYMFENPEIAVENGSIHVKEVYFLINGKKNAQAATYSIIDETVAAPGKILSDRPLVQPFESDYETDEIQVSFELIELR